MFTFKRIFYYLLFSLHIHITKSTIDLNAAELQYVADHLTPEECRRLVAAAHFKQLDEPKVLDKAGHRLRQMGKHELADWLGKTVFHELGQDLEHGLEKGLDEFLSESSTENVSDTIQTLKAKVEDSTRYSISDSVLYVVAVGFVVTITSVFLMTVFCCIRNKLRKRKRQKTMVYQYFDPDEVTSGSESEEKFDIRTYTSSSHITQ